LRSEGALSVNLLIIPARLDPHPWATPPRFKRAAENAEKKKRNGQNGYQLPATTFHALVRITAKMMRKAEPTAFAVEGPRYSSLRAGLCLQGWPWIPADLQAAAVVHAALRRVRARRPSWIEGQLEYCNGGFVRDDICWNCGDPLPHFAKKFCCDDCCRTFPRIASPRWPEQPSREYEKLIQSLKQKSRRRRSKGRGKVKRAEAVSEPV
jgi:hypothetical protein